MNYSRLKAAGNTWGWPCCSFSGGMGITLLIAVTKYQGVCGGGGNHTT